VRLYFPLQEQTLTSDPTTARFGDTAANAGILALLSSNPFLAKLPSPLKTAFASVAAALFRMILVPVDTLKVNLGFGSPLWLQLTLSLRADHHADARIEWSPNLEGSHQGLRDRNALVRSMGDGGRFLCRQLPLVSSLLSRSIAPC